MRCALFLTGLLLALPSVAAKPGDAVVAEIGGQAITLDDVDAGGDAQLSLLKDRLHWARVRAAQDLVSRRLLELEAKAQGLSVSAYLEREVNSKVAEPTPQEVEAFWKENPGSAPPEQRASLHDSVLAYLKRQRSAPLREALLTELRSKHAADLKLDIPSARLDMNHAGAPVKGPPSAPITIVAFTDYQCAGCASLVRVLEELQAAFKSQLRVVHRDFPNDAHDRALPAAVAARCAGRFGKYWAYHDLLFLDTNDLSPQRLNGLAERLELDAEGFADCLASEETAAEVQADKELGQSLGVTGTPHLFLNGLPLRGGLDAQTLASLVAMELDRLEVPAPNGG